MAAVAAEAGIATGTVYKHFENKAELVAAVFETVVAREVDAVRGRGAPPVTCVGAGHRGGGDLRRSGAEESETGLRPARRTRRPGGRRERLVFRRAFADVVRDR